MGEVVPPIPDALIDAVAAAIRDVYPETIPRCAAAALAAALAATDSDGRRVVYLASELEQVAVEDRFGIERQPTTIMRQYASGEQEPTDGPYGGWWPVFRLPVEQPEET